MITLLILLSLAILLAYVSYTLLSHKSVPSSISATYYRLRHKSLFSVAMFSSAAILMPAMLEIVPEAVEFLAFLGCGGMLFVAVSPHFKGETVEAKIHAVGATVLLICSQLLVALLTPYLLFAWGFLIAYLVMRFKRAEEIVSVKTFFSRAKTLFWVEVIAVITTYSMLLIQL